MPKPACAAAIADIRIAKTKPAAHAHIQALGASAEHPSMGIGHVQVQDGFMCT